MEAFVALALIIIAICGLMFSPTVIRVVAHLALTPESLSKIRRAIGDACDGFDLGNISPGEGEDDLNELARHAIGKTCAEINPRQAFKVDNNWPPDQKVTIVGDIAVIAPNIGTLLMGPHSRIEPITVRIKRNGVVKLDNRPPIKAVHDAIYEPPPKQAVAAAKAMPAPVKPMPAAPEARKRTLPTRK